MLRPIVAAAAVFALVFSGSLAAEPQAKKKDKDKKDTSPLIAHVKLSGALDEAPVASDPLFGGGSENFKSKLDRIAKAKADSQVKALFLEFNNLAIGFGKLDELRRAVADFKATGKKVYAYGEDLGFKDYVLALSCDLIGLPESGGVEISGIQAAVTFYKDLFEKVHVQADYLQMGDFKGAAEPYLRNNMSPEFRKQYETVIDDFFEKSYAEAAE